MSKPVTEFIKIDEVRNKIDSTYPNPGTDVEAEISVANNGYSHKLIGTTFEFLCALWLYRQCEDVIIPSLHASRGITDTEEDEWVRGARYQKIPDVVVSVYDGMKWENREGGPSNRKEWEEMNADRPGWKQRSPVEWTEDEDLSKVANQFVETGLNTERVVRAALLNAGWKPDESVQSWINRELFEDDLLEEMEALFSLLRSQSWTEGDVLFEKPSFGNYRHILPGEGDFLVDNVLIDIKTTQNGSFTNSFWRQLLMYYVLNDIQRELYEADSVTRGGREMFEEKYPEITQVGIYFARYGELQTVAMEDIIQDRQQYEEFRAWIVDRAIEQNEHAQVDYSAIKDVLTEPYDYDHQQTLSDF